MQLYIQYYDIAFMSPWLWKMAATQLQCDPHDLYRPESSGAHHPFLGSVKHLNLNRLCSLDPTLGKLRLGTLFLGAAHEAEDAALVCVLQLAGNIPGKGSLALGDRRVGSDDVGKVQLDKNKG